MSTRASESAQPPEPTQPGARRSRIRPWHIVAAASAAILLAAGTAGATSALLAASVASGRASAAAGTSSAAIAANTASVDTTGFPSGGRNPGIFTDTCALAKTAPDDPIMMPGMTGMSMQHDFFGSKSVAASSAPSELVGSETTCSTTADSSAYWTPVVYQNGTALKPRSTLVYWRAPAASAAHVTTMPAGITMIAGNEVATSAQSAKVINWTCTPSLGQPNRSKGTAPAKGTAPRDCGDGSRLRLVITFPNCWDGHTLDGQKQTNVVYADGAACPSSHPVQIPQIVMHIAYPTSTAAGLTLSIGPTQQGPTVTGHADFMSGWKQSAMDADVAACITTQTRCGHTAGADATPQGRRARS